MKNIHILPTDKPSRLAILHDDKLHIGTSWKKDFNVNPQHIYITSDEEIKEGDYVCASGGFRFVKTLNNDKFRTFKDDGIVSKQNPSSSCHLSNYKKIILTTDQDLIADGVQAIDDEFLEWFVKNPSCEGVEVTNEQYTQNYHKDIWYNRHKIIIPKEESKQIKCYCGHTTYCDCSPLEEPKQETLEEAAERILGRNEIADGDMILSCTFPNTVKSMVEMAKWQAERMYSEEELKHAFFSGCQSERQIKPRIKCWEEWFEQFKKK